MQSAKARDPNVVSIDSSVLVRLLTNDDRKQARRAAALVSAHEIFIPATVLVETEWVLRHGYRLDRTTIGKSLRAVLGLPNVAVQNAAEVDRALALLEDGMDFTAALHLATSSEAVEFKTFDTDRIEQAQAVGLRHVSSP